jgi:hypothetical protein
MARLLVPSVLVVTLSSGQCPFDVSLDLGEVAADAVRDVLRELPARDLSGF